MTARHARIVDENYDELGYWIEVNRNSMFAGLRQKSAAVALLFQALAALPQVALPRRQGAARAAAVDRRGGCAAG
jgi:hypothetical protein